MSRLKRLSMATGAVLLALGCLLIEIVGFRLVMVVTDQPAAAAFAMLMAAAFVLGAQGLSSGDAEAPRGAMLSRAAHLAGLAAMGWGGSIVTLIWVSQKVARSANPTNQWRFAVMMLVWTATHALAGGAMACLYRGVGKSELGRMAYKQCLGGAVGLLVLGVILDFGGPRGAMGLGVLISVAAVCLGFAAVPRSTNWPLISTAILAVIALLLGDLWVPWMKLRSHNGYRSRVTARVWSPGGLSSLHRGSGTRMRVSADRGGPVDLGRKLTSTKRPSFRPNDLIYYVDPAPKGRALVIGSAGANEVASALAHGHRGVDVVARDPKLVREIWLDKGRKKTRGLFDDPDRVRIAFGDRRVSKAARRYVTTSGRDGLRYQRIVVARSERYRDPPMLALSTPVPRRYTVEAIREYFGAMTSDGAVILDVATSEIPSVLAGAKRVLGGSAEKLRSHTHVCSSKKKSTGVVLLRREAIDDKNRQKLRRRCRRGRLEVAYPLEAIRKGHRDYEAREAERSKKMDALESGTPSVDDRPVPVASLANVLAQMPSTFAALSPEELLRRARPRPTERKKQAKKTTPRKRTKRPVANRVGGGRTAARSAASGKAPASAKKPSAKAPAAKPAMPSIKHARRAPTAASASTSKPASSAKKTRSGTARAEAASVVKGAKENLPKAVRDISRAAVPRKAPSAGKKASSAGKKAPSTRRASPKPPASAMPAGSKPPRKILSNDPLPLDTGAVQGWTLFGALLLMFVGAVVGAVRDRSTTGIPRTLRWSLPLFGMAVGSGSLLVVDVLRSHLGATGPVYTVLLPSLLMGMGMTRLLVDRSTNADEGNAGSRSPRGVLLCSVLAMGLILPFSFAEPMLATVFGEEGLLQLPLAGGCALLVGATLGYPLAAGVRAGAEYHPVHASGAWAGHQMGVVIGVALSALLVTLLGVTVLGLFASCVLALGSLLFLIGLRHAPNPGVSA